MQATNRNSRHGIRSSGANTVGIRAEYNANAEQEAEQSCAIIVAIELYVGALAALSQFYRALNNRDIALMEKNRYGEVFIAIGRERGQLVRADG